jgi:hypothetical protein
MKPATLVLLAGAGLLLLMPRRAAAQPAATVAGAPRQDYANPFALAATEAARALAGIITGYRATPTAGDTANSLARETARDAVRAGDPYYGDASLDWYRGNTEEARAAVRQGDAYYLGDGVWTVDQSYDMSRADY